MWHAQRTSEPGSLQPRRHRRYSLRPVALRPRLSEGLPSIDARDFQNFELMSRYCVCILYLGIPRNWSMVSGLELDDAFRASCWAARTMGRLDATC